MISVFAILMMGVQCGGSSSSATNAPHGDNSNHGGAKQFNTSCYNGIPSTTKVFKENIEKCVSCNSYYVLKSNETCAIVSVKTLMGIFPTSTGVAVDNLGNVYVADKDNYRIRKITPDGEVSTLAGTGVSGDKNGKGDKAKFVGPDGVAGGLCVLFASKREKQEKNLFSHFKIEDTLSKISHTRLQKNN